MQSCSLYAWSDQRANLTPNVDSVCWKAPFYLFLEQSGQPVAYKGIL